MKIYLITFLTLIAFYSSKGQDVIQTINSGSIISSNSMVSIGEILIIPENQNQSSSGLLGIISVVNQNLEVATFDISENITVFPNPTVSKLNFKTNFNIINEKLTVYDNAGKLVLQTKIDIENSIDLSNLPIGNYFIQFENKNYKSFKIIKK